MSKSLFFKQKKPLTVVVLGGFMLVLSMWFWLTESGPLSQIIAMGLLAVLLLGYATCFEISKDFKNKKHLRIFGISVFSRQLKITFPDYIAVFSAENKQGAEWGAVAAIGKQRTGESYVVRLFNGNEYFTVYRTKSIRNAKDKATALSALLGVEFIGKD